MFSNKNSFCLSDKSFCIARDFEPASWRKNSAHRRRRCWIPNPEFIGENRRNSVGGALRRPLLCSFKTFEFNTGVSTIPSSNIFSKSIINGRSFAKTIFWGKDFAKLRLMFLKFGGVLNSDSRAAEGSGEESARASAF